MDLNNFLNSELITILKQPAFWFLSIIGSFFISVAANILTPRIISRSSRISKSFQEKKLKDNKEKKNSVIEMHFSIEKRINSKLDAIFEYIFGIALFLLACSSFAFGYLLKREESIIFYIFGAFLVYFSGNFMGKANDIIFLARLADKREKAIKQCQIYNSNYSEDEKKKFIDDGDKENLVYEEGHEGFG